MLGNLVNLLVWLLVAAGIVLMGWNEPLNYKFKTSEQINAEEKALLPPPPPPTPVPDYRTWAQPKKGPNPLGEPSLDPSKNRRNH